MPLRVYSTGELTRIPRTLAARAKHLLPATRRIGEFIAREARRRAPVGAYKGGTLRRSLNHIEPEHNVTALASDVVHALPQQYGARISAPAKAGGVSPPPKMVAVPLTQAARQLLDTLGSRQSLRTVPGLRLLILPASGRAFLVRDLDDKEAKKARRAGVDRRGQPKRDILGRVEFLFLLRAGTRLTPNPPPKGYAPTMDEAPLREFAARAIRRYLTAKEA